MVEAQASSVSRYSTLGVPYIRKPFDYNVESGDSISEIETYLTRVSRARKNYLPIWTYTPFLVARSLTWSTSSYVDLLTNASPDSYPKLRFLLLKSELYTSATAFFSRSSHTFNPTNSGLNTYVKSA